MKEQAEIVATVSLNMLVAARGFFLSDTRGLYEKKTLRGGKYQLMSFGGKNMKRRREKGGKCKRKRKKRGGKRVR
jgi:hypothetical protein